MSEEKVRILENDSISAKLKRMAFQIYEKNFEQTQLVVVGIDRRGGHIAKVLIQLLKEISPLKIESLALTRDREEDELYVPKGQDANIITGQTVLIVDDVLYSGKTMMQALSLVMDHNPETVRMGVLIDRGHRNYPLSPDYLGMDLATTLKQHVSVEVDGEKIEAFLK